MKAKTLSIALTGLCLCSRLPAAAPQPPPSAPKPHFGIGPVKAMSQPEAGMRLALFYRGADPRAVEQSRKWKEALDRGDAQRKAGDLDGALRFYQDALSIEPDDSFTLQEMAEVYTAKGQTDKAIATYRKILHDDAGSLKGNNVTALMHFAQALIKTGQPDEALGVYRYALGFVNYYAEGQPRHEALLPDLGPTGWAYTPERLQAMVDVAIALENGTSDEEQAASLREAARLFPRSALPLLYLGIYLLPDDKAAKASFQKAADLSDGVASAVAKSRLAAMR